MNRKKDADQAHPEKIHKQFVTDVEELLLKHLKKDILPIFEESEDGKYSFSFGMELSRAESVTTTKTRMRFSQVTTDDRINIVSDPLTEDPENPPLLDTAELTDMRETRITKKGKRGRPKKHAEAVTEAEANGAA